MCLSFHMGCPCTPVSVSFVKLILFLCVHQSRGFVLVGFAIFWFVLVISFSSYLCLFIFFQFWAFSHVCPRVLSGTSLRSCCSVVNWSVYARFGNNLFSILLNIGWYGKSCKNIGIQRKGKKRKRNSGKSHKSDGMKKNKTLWSIHFGVEVVELINCKCGRIVRNEIC